MLEIQSRNWVDVYRQGMLQHVDVWNDHKSFTDNTVISRKEAHPPFVKEVVAKGAFLLKVRPPIDAAVHVVMLSKNHWSSSTVQEEGQYCYCISKCMTQRGIAESLHACHVTWLDWLSVKWAYFERDSWKHVHPLWSHLSSLPTKHIFRWLYMYGIFFFNILSS